MKYKIFLHDVSKIILLFYFIFILSARGIYYQHCIIFVFFDIYDRRHVSLPSNFLIIYNDRIKLHKNISIFHERTFMRIESQETSNQLPRKQGIFRS